MQDDGCHALIYTVDHGVAVLTIHRPARMNAWTPELDTQLKNCLERAADDAQVRCVVITGAGCAFCAGMDMGVLTAPLNDGSRQSASDTHGDQRYGFLDNFEKPLIAAINGAAVGVGLCIALYCDVRYVVPQAKLAMPYTRRGLVAEHGLAWLLPHLIGPMHASDLLISGRSISGK